MLEPPPPIPPTHSAAPGNWSHVRAQQYNAAKTLTACFSGILLGQNEVAGDHTPGHLTATHSGAITPPTTVAKPAGRRKHPQRYALLATDGVDLVGPGCSIALGSVADVAELATAARGLVNGRELVVFVHETAHGRLGLSNRPPGQQAPAPFLAPGRRVGMTGWTVVEGNPSVHVAFPGWSGDFAGTADAAALLDAVEAFRTAVDFTYLFSAAATVHKMINGRREIGVPEPHPPIEWAQAAWSVPTHTWLRPLSSEEQGRGWVRAFDRNGSYLAAWRSCVLGLGEWVEEGPRPLAVGPESRRPSGYWLIDPPAVPAGLPDPFTRHRGRDGDPIWVTTPLVQLATELGSPVRLYASYVSMDKGRALDAVAARLDAARLALADQPAPLGAVKECYKGGTAWFEHGLKPPEPLARPDWRRTIIDRHCANTFRALQKAAPGPFALSEIDCALFALESPDAVPEGLRMGSGLGAWKPKGEPVPMTTVAAALESGGARAALRLAEGDA